MKFYVIDFENGKQVNGEFYDYFEALQYAELYNYSCDFTISEYDSEDDYFNN